MPVLAAQENNNTKKEENNKVKTRIQTKSRESKRFSAINEDLITNIGNYDKEVYFEIELA